MADINYKEILGILDNDIEPALTKLEDFMPRSESTSTESELGKLIWNLSRAWSDLSLFVNEHIE